MLLKSVLASIALVASSSIQHVSAFTNGTLLPSYICGPPTDGMPKSLGGVLPYFVLNTNYKFVNQINADGKSIAPERPLDAPLGRVNNTQFLVAGFHNSANGITAGKAVVSAYILVSNDPKYGTPDFVPVPDQIYPGREHVLTLTANTVDNPKTPSDAGIALDGAVVYVTYTATGSTTVNRIGNFVTPGPTAQIWPACGPFNAGVVHNQLLSDTNTYNGYVWRAPADLQPGSPVTFKGAAVTDLNYGAHSTVFLVAAAVPGPSLPSQITKVVLLMNKQAQIYFVDPNRGSPKQATTSFKVTYSLSSTMPANTIGTSNIPTQAAAPAAIVAQNTTVTIMNTMNTASPITIDIATALKNAGVAGAFMTVSMINTMTNQADSVPSNVVSFSVGASQKTTASAAEVLIAGNYVTAQLPPSTLSPAGSYPFTSLCDTASYNAALSFNYLATGLDPDASCTQFLTMTTSALAVTGGGTGTVVNGAASVAPSMFVVFAALLAVLRML